VSYHRDINFQYPVIVLGAASNELSLLIWYSWTRASKITQ
jgi:hypothetical protein